MDISRALIDLNPDGVIGFDLECRYTIWNPVMERISGMRRDEVIGRNAFELFPFLEETGEDACFRAALAGETAISRERPYNIPERQRVGMYEAHYVPVRDEAGRITGGLGLVRDVTARHEAEAHARENRELFESYMAHIPGVAFMKDSDGRHVYANRHFEETHGLAPREWEGKLDADIFPPDTARRFRDDDLKVLAAGTPLRMIDQQGARSEPEHWMWVKFPFSDAAGRRLVAGLAFNVTEQHRAAEALRASEERFRQSEARFRAIFEQSPFSVQIVEPSGRTVLANPAFETLWSVPREVLRDYNLLEDPQVAALGVLPHVQRAFEGHAVSLPPVYYDPAVTGNPGRGRWTEAIFYPVRDAEGNVRELVLMHRDVTERVQLEQERAYVQAISDAALSQLPIDDLLRVVADRLRDVLKVDATAILLKSDAGYVVRVAPGAEALVNQPVASLDAADGLICVAGFAGCATAPLALGAGPFGVVAAARRERPLADEELRLLRTMADRIALVIEHAELVAELQQANRRKDEFLATLGHELRNPLAPLLTAAELLRVHGTGDPVLRHAQDVVARQAQQMRRLIDDLLDVARITRGFVSLHLERIDLREPVQEAVKTAATWTGPRDQSLDVTMPDGPVYADADRVRVEQVVTNLLTNAAKFTPRGGRIRVSVAERGGEILVSVADTGKGIPREMLPRVFDLFTQVNPSADRAEGGLGLGLTLVKRLVEMHGGSIAAASAGEGQGAEFRVHFPARPAPEAPAVPSSGPCDAQPPGGCRVLIVDDNVDSAEMLSLMLPMWGYHTEMAHSGPEAVERAGAFRPHIVLLDIGLPGMSGYDVARRLRSDEAFRGVALVAVTGFGQQEDRERTSEAGFAAHLTKPVDVTTLRDVLARLHPPD